MSPDHSRGPGVRVPPPLFFLAGWLLGWLLDRQLVRLRWVPDADAPAIIAIGLGVVILGAVLAVWGVVTFRRSRTAIIPLRPASQLVRTGPYKFSRNPMYTGMSIAYIGVSTVFNTIWPVLLLPVVLLALRRFVVRREEQYLTSAFGEDYREYTRQVRRWL